MLFAIFLYFGKDKYILLDIFLSFRNRKWLNVNCIVENRAYIH